MAKEYIKREDAYRAIKAQEDSVSYEINMGLIKAVNALDEIPAADVVEVRHGQWVEVEVKELAYYKMMIASMRCDQCGRYHNEVYHYGNPTEMVKYCGFCGAKMDGDGRCMKNW